MHGTEWFLRLLWKRVEIIARNFCAKKTLSCAKPSLLERARPGGWGGGVLPYMGYIYRYVRPQRVWFFSRFSHK